MAMYRFPVSWEMKRRVSCFTNVGYSLKIQENIRAVDKAEEEEENEIGGNEKGWRQLKYFGGVK